MRVMGVVALSCALAKELSGEAHLERACPVAQTNGEALAVAGSAASSADAAERSIASRRQAYVQLTERRFTGVNRCC